jgi:ABC-type antimicrobial peptide transport system permease subunit
VISILSAAFAAVATILAAVGLYGVLAYTVAQRTREIGVRIALGAAPGQIRGMVLRQVGCMTVIGGLVGLAAALALGKLAESLLFHLNGHDPAVLAGGECRMTRMPISDAAASNESPGSYLPFGLKKWNAPISVVWT